LDADPPAQGVNIPCRSTHGHCEGPDHLERLELLIKLRKNIAADAAPHLQPIYHSLVKQARDVQQVITAFGRHPHRNQVLGRKSTPAEEAYLKQDDFPHDRAFEAGNSSPAGT
jgi:hypothetical protein